MDDDLLKLKSLLEQGGAAGSEFPRPSGSYRRRSTQRQVHARYDFSGLGSGGERGNYTLFAMVPDEATAQGCLAAVEHVMGDLDGPNTGVLAAWPLAMVKGVPPLAQVRAEFHLYVPAGSVSAARRLCEEHHIPVAEICTYHPIGDEIRFASVYKAPPAARPAPRRETASAAARAAAPKAVADRRV